MFMFMICFCCGRTRRWLRPLQETGSAKMRQIGNGGTAVFPVLCEAYTKKGMGFSLFPLLLLLRGMLL